MAANNSEFVDKAKDQAPAEPVPSPEKALVTMTSPSQPSSLALVLSLLLGGATEGADQFVQRLRRWQAEVESHGGTTYSKSPGEKDEQRLRYALIGMLSSGTHIGSAVLSTAVSASATAYSFCSTLFRPIANSSLAKPIRRRYDNATGSGQTTVERWIDAGRKIEQQSRTLFRQAVTSGYDEGTDVVFERLAEDPAIGDLIEKQSDVILKIIIDKLAQDPAVRDLIRQQSAGMADEIKDNLRKRSAVADDNWEDRVHGLLHRH